MKKLLSSIEKGLNYIFGSDVSMYYMIMWIIVAYLSTLLFNGISIGFLIIVAIGYLGSIAHYLRHILEILEDQDEEES